MVEWVSGLRCISQVRVGHELVIADLDMSVNVYPSSVTLTTGSGVGQGISPQYICFTK